MSQNINQFAQTPNQGSLDLSSVGGTVFAARVSNNIGNGVTIVPGQAVKGDTATPGTSYDGIPAVLPLSSNSDPLLGFVKYSIKNASYGANARFELAADGTFMYMTADATVVGITRFGPVEFNTATNTVLAWQGVNPICGYAWDAAINAGDLIRVRIASPQISAANTNQTGKVAQVTATLAQINAGLILIPGISGKKITVTDYTVRVNGSSFAGGTNILLQSTNVTPVVVSTIAEAGLTSGAILKPASANTTLGAGFAAPLGTGDGLAIASTGTQTTATGATVTISYIQG